MAGSVCNSTPCPIDPGMGADTNGATGNVACDQVNLPSRPRHIVTRASLNRLKRPFTPAPSTKRALVCQYHRYRDDVRLMRDMGVRHYRFSVSWSRLVRDILVSLWMFSGHVRLMPLVCAE